MSGGDAGAAHPLHSGDFDTIRAEEAAWLAQRRTAQGLPAPAGDEVGLSFSGGGIRSAVFNLGVIEALESRGLMPRVDYLSSVSGGGYIAGAYSWLRAQLDAAQPDTFGTPLADGGGTALDWFRRHVQYLIAERGFSMWTLLASIGAAVFLNLLVVVAPLILITDVMTLGFIGVPWPALSTDLPMPSQHEGYLLLLGAAGMCFALWPFAALRFAWIATRQGLSSSGRVDSARIGLGLLPMFGTMFLLVGSIPVVAHWLDHWLMQAAPTLTGGGGPLTSLGAIASGAAAFWRGQVRRTIGGDRLAMIGLAFLVYGLFVFAYSVAEHIDTLHSPVFLGFLALSLLLGVFCNLNAISIHGYYRDRLRQALMPATAAAPKADAYGFRNDDITPTTGAPLHLVCATLNTRTSPDERRRSREGDCFSFSPLHYGSSATGWADARTNRNFDARLATSIAIAGAAVDPDSPMTRNRPLSILMAMFNLRLGYWGFNPNPDARRALPIPRWWMRIGREITGVHLDERWRDIHLSDGGQFENLGLYELIRRRLPYLIAIDAGSDPDYSYADLGNAIERVRVDFGAEIQLAFSPDDPPRPWRLGQVRYADGTRGRLLYFKPCLHGAVSVDVIAYQRRSPSFPNEPTSNQFFCEAQFEAYRWLARETVRAASPNREIGSVADWFDALEAAQDAWPVAAAHAPTVA